MSRKFSLALLASASILCATIDPAAAQSGQPVRMATNMGGGFIEFLFGDAPRGGRYQQERCTSSSRTSGLTGGVCRGDQAYRQEAAEADPAQFDPRYNKQVVDYDGHEGAGTIVINTPNKFLYLVQGDGKALRYGIGVGRPGFTWAGMQDDHRQDANGRIGRRRRKCWSAVPICRGTWRAARKIRSARARCISAPRSTASTAPTSPGPSARKVSSGCIRMRNEDVIDLYGRVRVGTRVMVI